MKIRSLAGPAIITATLALSGCGSSQHVPSAGHPSTDSPSHSSAAATSTPATPTASVLPSGQRPVAQDGPGYQDAVTTFGGATHVQAAADKAVEIARLATTNCSLWTTPGADPMTGLDTLLTPDTYNQVKAKPTSLLIVSLPTKANGQNPLAEAKQSCTDTAPLRLAPTGFATSVDRSNPDQPRLILSGPTAVDVTLGGHKWTVTRDWTFGLIPGPNGWMLAGADYKPTDLSPAGGE